VPSVLVHKPKVVSKAYLWRLGTHLALNEQGSVLPIMTALLMMATTGGALAVDIARAYAVKSELQTAADSAALAAAIMLPDVDAAKSAAATAVQKNVPGDRALLLSEDFEFGTWDAAGRLIRENGGAASAVRVTVKFDESRGNGLTTLFAGIFGENTLNVAASAAAGKRGVTCLIALDPSGKGLELNGDAQLELQACGAQVNSTDDDAFKASDDTVLVSDGLCVSGGADMSNGADISPAPTEYCPPQTDPMQALVMPDVGPCVEEEKEYKDKTVTLSAGHVFCNGLKVSGNSRITLEPGLYIVHSGKFELQDDAVLEGDGVTIMLYGEKAEFDIKDDAALHLTAPTEGPLKGLAIIQSEGSDKDNKWDSKAVSTITGVVYLPDGKFTSKVEANITGTDACFVLIAAEIKIDGNAKMLIDLSSTACRSTLPTAFSRSIALLD